MSMHFLPDQPLTSADADALGFTPFVDQLHRAILGARPPFVFGVLGDWGTGKTSILRMLESRLTGNGALSDDGGLRYIPIWFDAWRYENEANTLYPLLHAIRKSHEQVAKPQQDGFLRAFQEVVLTSAFVLGDLGLRGATHRLIGGDGVGFTEIADALTNIRDQREPVVKALGSWTNAVDHLRDAFHDLLDAYAADVDAVAPERVRFVILIDDLDRCLPDTTLKLLESIKHHLDAPNAIFVLALNAGVVYQGIRHKYGSVEINGREYMEKIINFSFYVPEPERDALKVFATDRLRGIVGQLNYPTQWDEPIKAFGKALNDCHFTNPRKIKRILNRYVMFLDRPDAQLARFDIQTVIRLLVLAEYFPDVFLLMRDFIYRPGTFNSEHFQKFYNEQTGAVLFNRYPQLAIMRALLEIPELRNQQMDTLVQHVNEIYQLTRLL